MNERHTEYSEIYEDSLNKKTMDKSISWKDEISRKATYEDLMNVISKNLKLQ